MEYNQLKVDGFTTNRTFSLYWHITGQQKILALNVRSILGYIEVAEPKYALSFFELALVFEIWRVENFPEQFLRTETNSSTNIIRSMIKQLRHCFVEMSVLF